MGSEMCIRDSIIQVLFSLNMTPPAKWFLDREDDSVFVCTSAPGTGTSPGRIDRQGIVKDIKTGLVKGKPVLKVRPYTHQCLVISCLCTLFFMVASLSVL